MQLFSVGNCLYLSFVAFVSAKWWPLHFHALEQERELLAIQVMAIRMKNNSFCDQLILNFNLSFVLTYADSKQKKKQTNTQTPTKHTHTNIVRIHPNDSRINNFFSSSVVWLVKIRSNWNKNNNKKESNFYFYCLFRLSN